MDTTRDQVKLRRRKRKTGVSLFLEISTGGKRKYEFLHLYLIPENSRADKDKNRETLRMAEAIRAKRLVEVRNHEYGFKDDFAEDTRFFDYYRAMCEERHGRQTHSNWGNWQSALHHLEIYERDRDITFAEITPEWIRGFRDYLEKDAIAWQHDTRDRLKDRPLARNSKLSYFNKLRACLNQAFEERIIARNPMRGIEGFKEEEGTRMYLTLDEVRKVAATEWESQAVRTAFLFSCLTGLRRSDIERLTWGEVFRQGGFTRIVFRQKKTGGQEYLDITDQAAELMGPRRGAGDLVFENFYTPGTTNRIVQEAVLRAGIDKKITFHCGRHTFATMMLDIGTDIYTVSKLLGHRELSTTQRYTRVLDKNKQAAVAGIPPIDITYRKG